MARLEAAASIVSIPSLAGQTARLLIAAPIVAALIPTVSIPSLAGQTARRMDNARETRFLDRFNPLISGADRAALDCRAHCRGTDPDRFNPLISGADRAANGQRKGNKVFGSFQSPH